VITPEKLAEWEALAEKATPGPWQVGDGGMCLEPKSERIVWVGYAATYTLFYPSEYCVISDAKFTAAARTALPEAIAEIRRLQAENAPTADAPDKAENLTLRRLLWRAHSDGTQYGDDGEMQLGMIDFKRDPVDSIQAAIRDRGLRKLMATECTRTDYHEGPCNGYPRESCPQLKADAPIVAHTPHPK